MAAVGEGRRWGTLGSIPCRTSRALLMGWWYPSEVLWVRRWKDTGTRLIKQKKKEKALRNGIMGATGGAGRNFKP